jgi:hypothetical protein
MLIAPILRCVRPKGQVPGPIFLFSARDNVKLWAISRSRHARKQESRKARKREALRSAWLWPLHDFVISLFRVFVIPYMRPVQGFLDVRLGIFARSFA